MAETCQPKKMFVKEHQSKSHEVEIQEIEKYRHMRTGPGCLCKVVGIQEDCPGRNDQEKHDYILPGKSKIVLVDQVGQKICEKIGNNGNENIQQSEDG